MFDDPYKRKKFKKRADSAVQIVAFFIAVLFIGGVVMSLSVSPSHSQTLQGRSTAVFYAAPPKVLTPKDFGLPPRQVATNTDDDSDLGAYGEPGSESEKDKGGGWSSSARAAETAPRLQ